MRAPRANRREVFGWSHIYERHPENHLWDVLRHLVRVLLRIEWEFRIQVLVFWCGHCQRQQNERICLVGVLPYTWYTLRDIIPLAWN